MLDQRLYSLSTQIHETDKIHTTTRETDKGTREYVKQRKHTTIRETDKTHTTTRETEKTHDNT